MGSEDVEDCTDNALNVAVRFGDYEDAKQAIEDGCNPNTIGVYMWSPLQEAAQNGDIKILRLLLNNKGDPNSKDRLGGYTAVHYASRGGHVECLKMLLDAGGLYSITNQEGESAIDVATDKCEEVLQRRRVQDLIKLSRAEAKKEATKEENKRHKPKINITPVDDEVKDKLEEDIDEIIELEPSPVKTSENKLQPRAWGSVHNTGSKKESSDAVAGYLQLSFEYNTKKESLKVRVWQVTELLLPPPENSTISTIYVKSYIYPDKKKNSKRKTEEVRVEAPNTLVSKTEQKLRMGNQLSLQTVFKPSSFKFTKALEYSGLTKTVISEKVMELQVFITQKYTRKSFIIANMKIPLDIAVKKLVREHFPIKPCMQETLPETMKVFTSDEVRVVYTTGQFSSIPNLRNPSFESLRRAAADRAHSDSKLQDILVHSMERNPSVEISMPLDGSGSRSILKEISIATKNRLRRKTSRTEIVMPLDLSGNKNSLKGISVVRELDAMKCSTKATSAVSMPGEISSDDLDASGNRQSLRGISVVKPRKESIKTAIMNTSVYIPGDVSSDEPAGVHVERPGQLRPLHRRRSKSTPELTTTDDSEMSELENSLNKQKGMFSSRLKRDEYSSLEKGKSKKGLRKSAINLDLPVPDKTTPKLMQYQSLNEIASEPIKTPSPRAKRNLKSGASQTSIFDQPKTSHWDGDGNPLNFEGIPLEDLTPEQKLLKIRAKTSVQSPGRAVVHYEDDLTGEVTRGELCRKKSLSSYQPRPVGDYSPSKRSPRKTDSPISSPLRSRKNIQETSFSPPQLNNPESSTTEIVKTSPVPADTKKMRIKKHLPFSSPSISNQSTVQETSFSQNLGKDSRNVKTDDNHNKSVTEERDTSSLKKKYLQRAAAIQKQAVATPDYKLRLFQRTGKDPHPATPFEMRTKEVDLDTSEIERLDPFFIPETPTSSPAVHSAGKHSKKPVT